MDIPLNEWLQMPCLPEEVKGDNDLGYYLGIITIRKKVKFMEDSFGVVVHQSNFSHFLFTRLDKKTFASGSIELSIYKEDRLLKRLVGAYSFDIEDYDNERERNEQYAGTLKSLAIGNALGNEYPQFGSLLNQRELQRVIHQARPVFSTDKSVKNTLKKL